MASNFQFPEDLKYKQVSTVSIVFGEISETLFLTKEEDDRFHHDGVTRSLVACS